MIKKKKKLEEISVPEFQASINDMPVEDRIFVDRSLEISDYLFHLMTIKGLKQKDLAQLMGKSEAEVSKLLSGMQNITLRTFAKMEAALGVPVICTPQKAIHYFQQKDGNGELKDVVVKIQNRKNRPAMNYEQQMGKVIQLPNKNCFAKVVAGT